MHVQYKQRHLPNSESLSRNRLDAQRAPQRLSSTLTRAGNDNVITEMTAASWRPALAQHTADNKTSSAPKHELSWLPPATHANRSQSIRRLPNCTEARRSIEFKSTSVCKNLHSRENGRNIFNVVVDALHSHYLKFIR